MLLYSVGDLLVIGGQHNVEACDQICKDLTARMGEVKDWMTNFDVRIITSDTSVDIRRKLGGQHNRAQDSGCENRSPQLLDNFLQLAAEDTQCKKTVVTSMCEAIVEAGLTAKSGNTETFVKQMRPAPHTALTFGSTFTDALNKMVERNEVAALFTIPCFAGMQPKNLWRRVQYQASRSWQSSSALANCGGITWSSRDAACASTFQDGCYCLVSLLPFVVRHCNATPIQWAAATGSLNEVQ